MTVQTVVTIASLLIALVACAPAIARMWKRFRQPREVWICGEYQGRTKRGHIIWALNGVFASRDLALAACTKKTHFITPLLLNQALPESAEDAPVAEYPMIKEAA